VSLANNAPTLGPDGVRQSLDVLRSAISEPAIQTRLDQIAPLSPPPPNWSKRAERRWFTSFAKEVEHWSARSDEAASRRPSPPEDNRSAHARLVIKAQRAGKKQVIYRGPGRYS